MNGLFDDIALAFRQLLSLLSKAITGRTGAVTVDGGLTTIGLLVEDGGIRRPGGRIVSLLARRPCQVGGSLR